MTIGSAAFGPGHEPAPLPSFHPLVEDDKHAGVEQAMPGDSAVEGEIWYPTAPQTIVWPRVFPQL